MTEKTPTRDRKTYGNNETVKNEEKKMVKSIIVTIKNR